MKTSRLDYLDLMRATLMMLGVVLHSAQLFNPRQPWVMHAENSHVFFTYIAQFITSFRMPAFFVVSGFFCMMLVTRMSLIHFLLSRTQRIIVPMLFAALVLNALQYYFLMHYYGKYDGWEFFFIGGEWVQHLWFLIYLLTYIYLLLVLFSLSKLSCVFQRALAYAERINIHLLLFSLPFIFMAFIFLQKIGLPVYESYLGFFHAYTFFYYLSFFFFGALIFSSSYFFNSMINIHPIHSLLVIFSCFFMKNRIESGSEFIDSFIVLYTSLLISWYMVSLCFVFFHAVCREQSKFVRFISDSSYTVYLFHHILVVIFGSIAIHYKFNVLAGFAFTLLLSALVSILIHYSLVSRFRVFRFLLNGK